MTAPFGEIRKGQRPGLLLLFIDSKKVIVVWPSLG